MLRSNLKIGDYYPPNANDFVDPHRAAYAKREVWPDLQDQFSNTPYRYGALVRKGWGQVHKNFSDEPCRSNFEKVVGGDGTEWCVPTKVKNINNYLPTYRPQNDYTSRVDATIGRNIFHENSINPFTGERQYFVDSKHTVMRGHRLDRSGHTKSRSLPFYI